MSYTLHLGHPDAEPYKHLDYEQLLNTFIGEVRQSITDMGSGGYDPSNMLELMGIHDYDSDKDPDGELWHAAATAEIERVTWRFVRDNEQYLLDFAQRGRLPDNISWWVTEEDDA
jgi:hypothetical protein